MMLFHRNKVLFGNGIDPSCRYCTFSSGENPDGTCICKKDPTHPKKDGDACRMFHYDPLMRKPRQEAPLPTYRAEDFKL